MELVNFEEYSQDFTWDMTMHFPIPTLTYILNRMGWDIQDGRNDYEAKGYVLAIVREARNFAYAKAQLTNMDRKRIEWHMAHKVEYIYEMLEYVMSFLQLAYTSGELENFYKVLNDSKFNIPAINYAMSNVSFLNKFVFPYHVEYEGF